MIKQILGLAVLMAGGAAQLVGQTTDTQRAAAADVLKQIEALQNRLAPAKLAERLTAARNPDRDQVMARAAGIWDSGMGALSDWIGRNPEVGWKEFKAVDTLTKVLETHGFAVEKGSAGLATAFVAKWQSPAGKGLVLGVIAEYDALRDTEGAFHGDQHNAQSPIAISAAVAMQEWLRDSGTPGTIVVFGTPAEEVGPPAKKIMFDAGVFNGTDLIVRSHASTSTSRARAGFGICCLNINEVKYIFSGTPSHQLTSWYGRNALAAAVHFYSMVDGLRSSFRPEASIQGVIPEGGVAPNVVPQRAVVDYYIRYPDGVYLEHITRMVDNAAKAAALATGTELKIDRYGEFRDGITFGTLEELSFGYAQKLGAPAVEPEPQRPSGYEETGVLSRIAPGVGVSIYSSRGSYHTRGMLADTFSEVGHRAFRIAAQVMAAVMFDFTKDGAFRSAVQTEHATMKGLFDQYQDALKRAYASEIGQQ
ncbi:MAG: M20 family metallopeptidase [Gemmatimonadetes bacterium]|nr:M20 family metallopeptidase [Gemmatimonadota bacterium]